LRGNSTVRGWVVGANIQKLEIRFELFRIGFSSLTERNRLILDLCNEIFSKSAKDFRVDRLTRRTDGQGLTICLCHINIYLSILEIH